MPAWFYWPGGGCVPTLDAATVQVMNRNPTDAPRLIESTRTPSGGVARRCKRVKRDGVQCSNPARSGFDVCWKHGAGSAKREAAAVRQPTGRPPRHGRAMEQNRYRTLREIIEEMRAAEEDLDNCDEELLAVHAAFAMLLKHDEAIAAQMADLPSLVDQFEAALETAVMEPGEYRDAQRFVADSRRLIGMVDSWLERIHKAAANVTTMIKLRADTAARRSQAEQLDSIRALTLQVRNIIWDLLPEEHLDLFEDRLRREVFAPVGVMFPEFDRVTN